MTRTLFLVAVCLMNFESFAEELPVSSAEQFLHNGQFARGETELLLILDDRPSDDEARFGLGVIQFFRAVENLGQALHEYGAVSEKATQPFLRLPVPKNDRPSTISYSAFGRVMDAFYNDLDRAEMTLAQVKDDDVKLRLRLANISFDFSGTGNHRTSLLKLVKQFVPRQLPFEQSNPEFRVHFDRGDIAWLRGYCHLLSTMIDAYRSVDASAGFEERAGDVFPKVESTGVEEDEWYVKFRIADPSRLRRMRLHFVSVCELNRETWKHIRLETDDDYEWLPHPKQRDQLNLPLTNRQIDAWLAGMAEIESMLKGDTLISGSMLSLVNLKYKKGTGFNLRKLLDAPPADFKYERIQADGINPRYLEDESSKPPIQLAPFMQIIQMFNNGGGFAYGIRLN